MNKYIKRTKTTKTVHGTTLYRIKCIKTFTRPKTNTTIKKGEIGGWVCNKTKLKGLSWIDNSSIVIASTLTNSVVTGESSVLDSNLSHTSVYDETKVIKCTIIWYTCAQSSDILHSNLNGGSSNRKCYVAGSTVDRSVICCVSMQDSRLVNSRCSQSVINGVTLETTSITDCYLSRGSYLDCILDTCILTHNEQSSMATVNVANINLHITAPVVAVTNSNQLLTVGPSPTSGRYTTGLWDVTTNKLIICCGCFEGTLEEFIDRINETHQQSPVGLAVYTMFIDILVTWSKLHEDGTFK